MDVIDEMVRRESRRQAEEIERKLLTSNRVVVDQPNGQRIVYEAPQWRRHPRRRLRLEWLRLRRRTR